MPTTIQESSTIVSDAASGDAIATRQSAENDDQGNSRYIQRIDFASGKCPSPLPTAVRGSDGTLNTVDPLDLDNLPSDLTNNLITIGDKSMLNVFIELTAYTTNEIIITPILYDNEATPGFMGLLESKSFQMTYGFNKSGNSYFTPILSWDTVGGWKVGLHVTDWADSGGSIYIKVYGWVI